MFGTKEEEKESSTEYTFYFTVELFKEFYSKPIQSNDLSKNGKFTDGLKRLLGVLFIAADFFVLSERRREWQFITLHLQHCPCLGTGEFTV